MHSDYDLKQEQLNKTSKKFLKGLINLCLKFFVGVVNNEL